MHGARKGLSSEKVYLYIVIVAVALSIVYWALFSLNAYNTFHEYSDLGFSTLSMYYHIHYPAVVGGLEYLIFWNHISPDQLLILPIFYIWQSSMTLLIVQDVVLSLTGLLIFFVARDLLKSRAWALVFCIVYLVNPGMHGMLVFDYHAEFLIIPFYVLTFYFYMKTRRKAMIASLLLLLGSIEGAAFLAIFLGIGLFLFDYAYNKDVTIRRARMDLAMTIIAVSIVVIIAEAALTAYLQQSYTTSYSNLPVQFKVINTGVAQLGNTATALPSHSGSMQSQSGTNMNMYVLYGVFAGILCFGALILFDPLITLIFSAPWLVGIFVLNDASFTTVWNQYFSYVLGGTIVAAMLGFILLQEKKGPFAKMLANHKGRYYNNFTFSFLKSSVLLITLFLAFTYPFFSYSKNLNNFSQDFLLHVGPQQIALDSQLESMISLIPQNASLLTEYFITSHVADRRYLDFFAYENTFFKPEYVLVDMNLNISLNAMGDVPYFKNFSANNPGYNLVAHNGTAMLFKLNDTT
jgi:uncharacterized membrane protein